MELPQSKASSAVTPSPMTSQSCLASTAMPNDLPRKTGGNWQPLISLLYDVFSCADFRHIKLDNGSKQRQLCLAIKLFVGRHLKHMSMLYGSPVSCL